MGSEYETTMLHDEDVWWERVFSAKELFEIESNCDRECFTFSCECRQRAIARVTQETGVCFAED